ncbi:MAG: TetR/AcrR family transcriptional regulator [Pseudomonadota bacterium]
MAKSATKRSATIDRLVTLFRTRGYDGASLSDLAAATGLGRASLYHHFPAGKEEMGRSALAQAGQRFTKLVVAPLGADRPARERLLAMVDGMEAFYRDGPLACLTNTMSLAGKESPFQPAIAASLTALEERIASAFASLGLKPDAAKDAAQDILATLHGALVVGRVMDDASVFDRAMDRLRRRITAA